MAKGNFFDDDPRVRELNERMERIRPFLEAEERILEEKRQREEEEALARLTPEEKSELKINQEAHDERVRQQTISREQFAARGIRMDFGRERRPTAVSILQSKITPPPLPVREDCSRLVPLAHGVVGLSVAALILWWLQGQRFIGYIAAIPGLYGLGNLRIALFFSQSRINHVYRGQE